MFMPLCANHRIVINCVKDIDAITAAGWTCAI